MKAMSLKTFIQKLEEARQSEEMEENPTVVFTLGEPGEDKQLLPEAIFKAQTSEGEYILGVNFQTQEQFMASMMKRMMEDSNNVE